VSPLVLFDSLLGVLASGLLVAVGCGMEEVIGYFVEMVVD
jgi:hypothetical protein